MLKINFSIIFFLILFFPKINSQCLIDNVTENLKDGILIDPQGCPSSSGPYLWGDDCEIAINRFISRSINMERLAELNEREYSCWGLFDPSVGWLNPVNCDPPYDLCSSMYCPDKYYQNIKMLVDIEAQFIARAATFNYGHEAHLREGATYYHAAQQLVCDINAAYDCADLSRPIIQGAVLEYVGRGARHIDIPTEIIEEFIPYMDAWHQVYYLDDNANPKEGLKFDVVRISGQETSKTPDITKLEAQMYMFYQAKTFIDFGYTALHMGIYYLYGWHDTDYQILYRFYNQIRDYATSLGSFVLLNGENRNLDDNPKLGGTNLLLFDFDGRPLRVEEVNSEVGGIDHDQCDGETADPSIFENTPCSNEPFPSILDPCRISAFGGDGGGISPRGCYYETVPYFIYFDFGSGVNPDHVDCPFNWSPEVEDFGVWGMDDTKWFAEFTSSECQEFWWENYYCEQRNYHNGNGFLQIPGMLIYKKPENTCNTNDSPEDNFRNSSSALFMLSDNERFVETVANVLEPEKTDISIVYEENIIGYCNQICNGSIAPTGFKYLTARPGYHIAVPNKDCSSTYSIHIKDPNGNWLPYKLGDTRSFYPELTGNYIIYIRQDNLALPGGSYTIQEVVNVPESSCKLIPDCNSVCPTIKNNCLDKNIEIFPNPISRKDKYLNIKYDYQIDDEYLVKIFNMQGKMEKSVKVFPMNESLIRLEMNISRSANIYVIALYDGQGNFLTSDKVESF